MSAEQTPDIEALAAIIWAHTGEMCDDRDCGDGFGYHDLDSSEERRRGCRHVAQALAPVLAAAVREAEQRALREAADGFDRVVAALGTTDPGDPVRSGLIEGYRDCAQVLRDRADRVAEPQHEAATSGKGSEASDE